MITVLVAGGLTLTLVLVTSYPLYFEKKIPIWIQKREKKRLNNFVRKNYVIHENYVQL